MEKIRKIIAETFRVPELEIASELCMKDIDSWDSLTHMEMIANLESEFGIEFTADEIMEMVSVVKIEEVIGAKLNGSKG